MLIAGSNEFSRNRVPALPLITLKALSEAYTNLDYDLGLLTKEETDFFCKAKLSPPKGFVDTDELSYREFEVSGGTVGVVIFPGLKGAKVPSKKMTAAITRMCKEKIKQTDLLIGLSTWGYWGEQAYLKDEQNIAMDILLGSGPGVEVSGAIMSNGHVWWNRAYGRGKFIIRLNIKKWPSRNGSHQWIDNNNIHAKSIMLTSEYVEDKNTLAIIAKALH